MAKSRETLLVVSDFGYPAGVARALKTAGRSPEPVQAGVEAILTMAELNPEDARAALWRLQTDWETLRWLEGQVGGEPTQAVLRIGAVIHLARAELSSPAPQLRQRLPEFMEWLGRREPSGAD